MPIDLSVPAAAKAPKRGKVAGTAESNQHGSAGPAAAQRSRIIERAIARFREMNSNVGPRARIMFTERLALLLETGVSLHEALKGLRDQTTDVKVSAIIGAVADAILEGGSLSRALANHPDMFPLTYVNLVAAAEDGGFLPQVLAQLIEMDEKSERMRSMLMSALSYPAFLIFFSGATVVFVLVSVFPRFAEMFERIRSELPVSTIVLMALSELLVHHWPWVLAATGLLVTGVVAGLRQPRTRARIDALKLKLPLVRDLFIQIYLTKTLRVMSLSLANGVPLVDALHACKDLVRNSVFCNFIDALRLQVTEGRGIAAGFREAPFMPPMVQQMVATGEDTGNLAKVMSRIAEFYERELTKHIAMITRMAEPVMLLVMGSVVGVIVASLILPIFKLSRAVH